MAVHTVESIQEWIDGYTFTTNGQASSDILKKVLSNIGNGHRVEYGPQDDGSYTLTLDGPKISHTFVLKAAG